MTPALLKRHGGTAASLDTDARSSRRRRDIHKRRSKVRLVELLFELGWADAAKKVSACNSSYFALVCRNGHCAQALPTFRCRNRLCPYCAADRQNRAFKKLWPILRAFARMNGKTSPIFITLTFRNSYDSLEELNQQFKVAFKRLRRMKVWTDNIGGSFCGYEFTLTPTGWHYHVHILAFRKQWCSQADLAKCWLEASRGRGEIVYIRAIRELPKGLQQVLRYCLKPIDLSGWTANEVRQFQSMGRIKLSECFGGLRALNVAEEDDAEKPKPLFVGCPCPQCGEPLQRIKISWHDLDRANEMSWFVRNRDGPFITAS
jgi:hypothetical protein